MVWTATTLPFELVKEKWETLKKDRRPLAQWELVFDQLRTLDVLSKQVEVALHAATNAAADICARGGISPSKRTHSEVSPPTPNVWGDNLWEQFQDANLDPNQILGVSQIHLAVLDDHNKRIKVQEEINLKENMARCNQDMVEVHT